jgi:phospholipid transport system transporter-binding protein
MATEGFGMDGEGTVRVSGPLTFDTVENVRAAARAGMGPERWREESLTFDLGGVDAADSAGLALLVDWRRTAHREGGRIHFRGTPPALRAIAGLSGVKGHLFE